MPPAELPAAPNPSDTQRMAVVVQAPDPNHIPQWAVKGLIAALALIIVPGSIAVTSWVLGGIHSRLGENERSIQTLKEQRAAFDARLERVENVNRRQWELMSENKEKIGEHGH